MRAEQVHYLSAVYMFGSVQDIYGYAGGGKSLKTEEVKSIIFSNGLSGPKARLKLVHSDI